MDENNIFRLSALLYKDSNYDIKKENTLRKIIESLFIEENKIISVFDTIELCESIYNLNISEEDVSRVIKKYNSSFRIHNVGGGRIKFNLVENRFDYIKSYNFNNINKYIEEFIDEKCSKYNNSKEIIYRFLYEIFTTNLNSYEYFLKNKTISNLYAVDYSKYDEKEIEIINEFLNYDNPDKDKAIFDIVSLSLEYCILTGNGKQIYQQELRNKVFYLDSNIIYRAIGINGDERKKLTLKFIEKCKQINVKLQISKYSEDEFIKTLEYYTKNLAKHSKANVNISIYEKYYKGKDIYNAYLEWRSGRIDCDVAKFRAYIRAKYEKFKKENGIIVDYTNILQQSEHTTQLVEEISNSIMSSKPDSHSSSTYVDAKNILLIDTMRKKCNTNNNKLLEVKYFLISTDQKLREWDLCFNRDTQPIVFLPSQWLGIILRFVSATSDDYKSFVSFLNIKKMDLSIPKDKIQSVLEGISEITKEIKFQEHYAKEIIEENINDIINQDDSEMIYEKTKAYVQESMDKILATAQQETAIMKLENNNANRILRIQQNENVKIKMKLWKLGAICYAILLIISIIFILMIFIKRDSQYNLITLIYRYAGDDNAKNLIADTLCGLLGTGLFVFSSKGILDRINKKSKVYLEKEEEIKKQVINYTEV